MFYFFFFFVFFLFFFFFFFSSRRRHTRCLSDWSSDVCSSDLNFFSCQVLLKEIVPQTCNLCRSWICFQHIPGTHLNPYNVHFRLCCPRGLHRSEERRVGKECRSLWWRDCLKKKKN